MLEHLPIARQEARRFRAPRWVARQELLAAAYWGLCLAAVQCRDISGFPAYARVAARKAILWDLQRVIKFRIGPQARTGTRPIECKHVQVLPELAEGHIPLEAVIVAEEREALYIAIDTLTPVRQKAVKARLAGAFHRECGSSLLYAIEDLRAML